MCNCLLNKSLILLKNMDLYKNNVNSCKTTSCGSLDNSMLCFSNKYYIQEVTITIQFVLISGNQDEKE